MGDYNLHPDWNPSLYVYEESVKKLNASSIDETRDKGETLTKVTTTNIPEDASRTHVVTKQGGAKNTKTLAANSSTTEMINTNASEMSTLRVSDPFEKQHSEICIDAKKIGSIPNYLKDPNFVYDPDSDTAFFWKVPLSGGNTLEAILSRCFNLVLANNIGIIEGHGNDTVSCLIFCFFLTKLGVRAYICL